MTTLMALLPVAISGLIGIVTGLYFANKEHEQREKFAESEKSKQSSDREESQPCLPFVATR